MFSRECPPSGLSVGRSRGTLAAVSEDRRPSSGRLPWTRGLFGLAVAGPALALGGVHPEVVAGWTVVVGALIWRIGKRSRTDLVRPWPATALVFLAAWTALAALPIPGLRGWFAPELQAWVTDVLPEGGPGGVSVRPADTLSESIRLVGLAGVAFAAAQLSWRLSAVAVAASGLMVAGIGYVHAFVGTTKIFGVYTPRDALPQMRTALLGTFVNPNHQSGLLLLALFATAALALDQLYGARTARDAGKAEQRRDRGLAMLGGIALLLPALLLSLSRGALVALALFGPLALGLALYKIPASRGSQSKQVRRGPMALAVVALGGLVVAIGRHGAWSELVSLFDDPTAAYDEKLAPAVDATSLVWKSPLLGTGRGTFVDVFALHQPGSDRVFTHLESAPITAVVEWGLVVGGAVVLGGLWWWARALRHSGPTRERKARTLLLLGIAALGLQSVVDFSLEFIGVAAPLVALVGALTPRGSGRVGRSTLIRLAPTLALAGAAGLFALSPHGWAKGPRTNAAVASGGLDLGRALAWRPLDGSLHAVAARLALASDDTDTAAIHAEFATRTRAGSVDAWLMLSEVHARRGDLVARDAAFAAGLDRVRAPAPEPLIAYLIERRPQPQSAAAITPSRRMAFSAVIRGLRDAGATAHADAMAQRRSETHPSDPIPLLVRSQLAAERRNAALSLHFALLARATAPNSGDAHLAVVRATVQRHGVDRGLEALDAIPTAQLVARDRDAVDELRVRLLLQRGDADSIEDARELAENLLLHSPDESSRARRRALVQDAADAAR